MLVQQREEDYAVQTMREREGEIKDISEKMHQVNEIYRDLGEIVGQQQDQIDQLEGQFGDAADTTRRGLERIERANGASATSRRRRGDDCAEDGPDEGGRAGQFFLARHLRRASREVSAQMSAVADMVRVCTGGSAAAGYVNDQDLARRKK